MLELNRQCSACKKQHPPSAPPLSCCTGCLFAYYCNEACQEQDRVKHMTECAGSAVLGFKTVCIVLIQRGTGIRQTVTVRG